MPTDINLVVVAGSPERPVKNPKHRLPSLRFRLSFSSRPNNPFSVQHSSDRSNPYWVLVSTEARGMNGKICRLLASPRPHANDLSSGTEGKELPLRPVVVEFCNDQTFFCVICTYIKYKDRKPMPVAEKPRKSYQDKLEVCT
jgi:hypothetical protein